jgi:hypothetical protein
MRRFIFFILATVAVVAILLVVGWRSWTDILGGPLFITTEKVCQVTGQEDRQFNRPTLNPDSNITGTDLGSPVQWKNKLYFLFGDSRDTDPDQFDPDGKGFDSVAVGPVNWNIRRDGCPTLEFKADDTRKFLPIQLEEQVDDTTVTKPLGVFETPISGVASGDSLFAFFTLRNKSSPGCARSDGCALGDTGPAGGRTVLARLTDDGLTFRKVSDVSTGRFQWPVAVVRDIRTIPGLAGQIGLPNFSGQVAVIFAAGREDYAFRHGYPFLAVVPLQELSEMQNWHYFSGIVNGKPEFKQGEGNALVLPPFGHDTGVASIQPPPPNQCVEIRGRVVKSEENIADLKAQIIGATGTLLHGLAGRLTGALNQLAREKEALAECEKSPPPPPPYHQCVGELSVAYVEQWGKWAMLYSCGDSPDDGYNKENVRGIYLRTADVPWGPWSGPKLIFQPKEPHGYCRFMYSANPCAANEPNPRDEGVQNPKGQLSWGGEYAPMLLPTYTTVEGDSTSLYFFMSTWNPYQVVLIRTLIRPPSSLSTRFFDIFKGLSRQK